MERKAQRTWGIVRGFLLMSSLFTFLPFSVKAENIHDLHVSVCEVRWNESSSVFEVSIKIFIDDLEHSLKLSGAPDLFIGTDRELSSAETYVHQFFREHLLIEVQKQKLESVFIGKEIADDHLAVWCYLEYPATISRGQECFIYNDTLFELFDDQKNIMHIRMSKLHQDYIILQTGGPGWRYTF